MSRMEEKQKKSYYWFISSEKIILKILIIIMILLIIIQFLYMRQDIKINLNTIETLEGKSIEDVQGYIERGTIELELNKIPINTKKPQILINGEIITTFENNSVIIDVKDNDIIEVNGVGIKTSFLIKIISISDNVEYPSKDSNTMVKDNIVIVGKVKLK